MITGIDDEKVITSISVSFVHALNAVIGADIQLTSALLVRIEAHPGIYGSFKHATPRLFNIPITIGASYFQTPDLIFIAGLSIDPNSKCAGDSCNRSSLETI